MRHRGRSTWAIVTMSACLTCCYDEVLCDLSARTLRVEIEGVDVTEVDQVLVEHNGELVEMHCAAAELPGVTRCSARLTAHAGVPLHLELRTTDGAERSVDTLLDRGPCGPQPDPVRMRVADEGPVVRDHETAR